MKKSMQFSYYAKIIINIIVYVLFFVYIIGFIRYGEIKNKTPWVIFCIFAFLMALLYEVIRFLYDGATKSLVFDGLPTKANEMIDKVDKIDLLKTFRSSTAMMRILADIDSRDFDKLKKDLNAIDNEKEKVKNDYDVVLLKAYGQFVLDGETSGKVKESYKKLISVKETKTKKGKNRKAIYFFNWDVVDALNKYYEKNYPSTYNKLLDVDTSKMNKREAMHYYILKGISAKKIDIKGEAQEALNTAINLAGNNKTMIDYINSQK